MVMAMRNVFVAFLVFATLLTSAAADAPTAPQFAGVWEAKRRFGPDIRGPLSIVNRDGKWSADIGGHDATVEHQGKLLSFALPGGLGTFRGTLSPQGMAIEGSWIQQRTIFGNAFLSPVTLRAVGTNVWRGEVRPLDDTLTLYLVVKQNADGTLGAFVRNPEANIGRFLAVDSLSVQGPAVSLLRAGTDGKPGKPVASGSYDPSNEVLSIYFPQAGASFDFTRAENDPDSGFYPRWAKNVPYVYQPPVARDDGWPVSSLDKEGLSQEAISKFVQMLIDMPDDSIHASNVHGVLIARHGRLVLEEYFHGFSADMPHDTRSASKSMTSTMIAAAMQAHMPVNLDAPVYKVMNGGVFPPDLDPRKRHMTLRDLITMSSGLDCDDSSEASPGNEDTMQSQKKDTDWYHYTLSLASVREPGTKSFYCSGGANLAGGVLAKATGKPLTDLFRDLIAKPLGIKRYYLNLTPTGDAYMGGGMHLLPRDFMKLGQMMLNGGTWHGRRIVSQAWVKDATAPHFALNGVHYGYLWWVTDYPYKGRTVRAFYAAGNGGQIVMGIPELDLLIAFYGGNYSDPALFIPQRVFVPKYILPAVETEK